MLVLGTLITRGFPPNGDQAGKVAGRISTRLCSQTAVCTTCPLCPLQALSPPRLTVIQEVGHHRLRFNGSQVAWPKRHGGIHTRGSD